MHLHSLIKSALLIVVVGAPASACRSSEPADSAAGTLNGLAAKAAPSVPDNVIIDSINTYSCNLTWNASTDDDPRGVNYYSIYLDDKWVGFTSAPNTSYYLSGLSAGTTFDLKVAAVDFDENYTFTTAKSFTTATQGATTTVDYSKPPTPEFRATVLKPSYDFITQNGLRAMYVFDEDYNQTAFINDLKNAGVNALIVYTYGANISESKLPSYCDAWKRVQDETGMRVFLTSDFGGDSVYSNTQFGEFVSTSGERINAPDPLSAEYWQKVYADRAKVAAQRGLSGYLIDMEMYGTTQPDGSKPGSAVYPTDCVSDYDWTLFCNNWLGASNASIPVAERKAKIDSTPDIQAAWRNFREIELIKILEKIRSDVDTVSPNFMLGNVLYFETRGLNMPGLTRGIGTGTQPALVLDEVNYAGQITNGASDIYNIKENLTSIYDEGYPAILINGLSPHDLTPSGIADQLNKATAVKVTSAGRRDFNGANSDGYFIWSGYGYYENNVDSFYRGLPNYTPAQYVQGLQAMNANFNPHP